MTRNCLITESKNVILVRVRTDQVTGTGTAAKNQRSNRTKKEKSNHPTTVNGMKMAFQVSGWKEAISQGWDNHGG